MMPTDTSNPDKKAALLKYQRAYYAKNKAFKYAYNKAYREFKRTGILKLPSIRDFK